MIDLPEASIFDMDGTLCDVRGIRHLLRGPGRFHAFHMASIDCPPNQWVVDDARAEAARGRAVLVVTARQAVPVYRHVTAWWLALNAVPSEAMWMRAVNDTRPDYEVKREILAKIRTRFRPTRAWDDNPGPLRLWVEEGLAVTVVTGWPFENAGAAA